MTLNELARQVTVAAATWRAASPAAGDHTTDQVRAGHQGVAAIDELIRELYVLRGQLVSELRTDADAFAIKADARRAGQLSTGKG